MKINYNDGVKTMGLSHNCGIMKKYDAIKYCIMYVYDMDNHVYVTLENEYEYEFMLLALDICLYLKHDKDFMYIIQDAIITYEMNNLFYISIPNEEAHDKISLIMDELEKIANRHNMKDDLRTSSIYRMLTYARREYENRVD